MIQPTSYYQHISQFFYQNRVAAVVTGAALLGIAAYGAACLYNRYSSPKQHDTRGGLPELKRTYDLNAMLSNLDSIKGENKVCLFIGRQPHEELPVEEGKVWISGDIRLFDPIPEGRIQLWLDFSDAEQLTDLHGRFDEIVIDTAVARHLKGDFVTRFVSLLTESEERVLVFEPFDAISFRAGLTEVDYKFTSMVLPWEYYEQETKIEEAKTGAIEFIQKHCEPFFQEVTFHESDRFYYPSQHDGYGAPFQYIVAKGIPS